MIALLLNPATLAAIAGLVTAIGGLLAVAKHRANSVRPPAPPPAPHDSEDRGGK